MTSQDLKIEFSLNDGPFSPKDMDYIEEAAQAALLQEEVSGLVSISLSFVNGEEIQALNRDYRGVDAVTDVLSFPINEDYGDCLLLGDVVINLDRVASQAEDYGHSFQRELQYLTVHSILHCLGYDHIEEEDKREMRQEEKKIMDQLKVYRGE